MNITIRHAEPEDYLALNRVIRGSHAIWGTLVLPHTSVESSRKLVADLPPGNYWLVACVGPADTDNPAAGELVGSVYLQTHNAPRRRHTANLGLAVRDDWHQRGVGSALMAAVVDLADNWLNLMRLELTTWIDNEAALTLYRKFGFEVEGLHRAYAFRDGQYVDAYALARLRPQTTEKVSS